MSRGARLRRPVGAVVLLALLALAACGGDGDSAPAAAPTRVPDDLVPDTIDGLLVFENTDEGTKEAIANAGDRTLVSDTRIWELRRGDRLVGTLQIATVLPKVDLLDADVRDRFASHVILGQLSRIRVGDVEVYTTTADDKTVALWFGSEVFEVLQTKDRELDPEELLASILEYQDDQEGWVPLPQLVDFEQDE